MLLITLGSHSKKPIDQTLNIHTDHIHIFSFPFLDNLCFLDNNINRGSKCKQELLWVFLQIHIVHVNVNVLSVCLHLTHRVYFIIHSEEKENPCFLILVTAPEHVRVNTSCQHYSSSQNAVQYIFCFGGTDQFISGTNNWLHLGCISDIICITGSSRGEFSDIVTEMSSVQLQITVVKAGVIHPTTASASSILALAACHLAAHGIGL